jgi:hypothetical protein
MINKKSGRCDQALRVARDATRLSFLMRVFPRRILYPINNNHELTHKPQIGAMDIWQSGRQELLDGLKKVCDRVGADLAVGKIRTRTRNLPYD